MQRPNDVPQHIWDKLNDAEKALAFQLHTGARHDGRKTVPLQVSTTVRFRDAKPLHHEVGVRFQQAKPLHVGG